MRLLLCLAQRAGEVVSIEDLLNEVWSGVVVTQDSVYQAVASLRRVLGDDPKRPTYIATVPRLGYRMIASVGIWADGRVETQGISLAAADTPTVTSPPSGGQPWKRRVLLMAAGALCVAFVLVLLLRGNPTTHSAAGSSSPAGIPSKSVAVMPFLDLTTQDMNEEYFADGMTEELIDKLSRIPGLHVPGPTSSFYFKGKKAKVADIAHSLGVLYVLDGSIRKSNDTLRVAARLIRADDGYVIWSETYDRPFDNKLQVQDEIASQVAHALPASIR
jgi:TolB-like protein